MSEIATIIEFGCGPQPFPSRDGGERRITADEAYCGFDLFPDPNVSIYDIQERVQAQNEGEITIIRADCTKLDFVPSRIASVVACVNFFSDARTKSHREALLLQAKRLLVPLGRLVVVDTRTDEPFEELLSTAKDLGFHQMNRGHEHSLETVSQFAYPSHELRVGAPSTDYALIFQKKRFSR